MEDEKAYVFKRDWIENRVSQSAVKRLVRWWRRLIGRNVVYMGVDFADGVDTTCIMEYDSKTGEYTVLEMKQTRTT